MSREIKFRALTKDGSGIPGEKWCYWKLAEEIDCLCFKRLLAKEGER